MWLGTMSRMRPSPASWSAAASTAKPASPPSDGVERVVVGDVVAVRGAGGRGEDRRGVEVGDPRARQMRHDLGRVLEPEAATELQAISGAYHRVPPRTTWTAANVSARRRERVSSSDGERQRLAPVGMLAVGARQVDEAAPADDVLEPHGEQARGGARAEPVERHHDGVVERAPSRGPAAGQPCESIACLSPSRAACSTAATRRSMRPSVSRRSISSPRHQASSGAISCVDRQASESIG